LTLKRLQNASWLNGVFALGALLGMARSLSAEVRIENQGPDYLRLVYEADGFAKQEACLIGVPLDGEVQLVVIEARSAGHVPLEGDLEGLCLDGPVCKDEPAFLRNQRVVGLAFMPRQTADGRLEVYDRVVLDLYFSGATTRHASYSKTPMEEAIYRDLVTNYQQASPWRRTSRPAATKPLVQGFGGTAFRVVVREEGIYRISGHDLISAGLGTGGVESARLRLLYGGGRMLSEDLDKSEPVEFSDLALVVEDGGDGRLDEDDFVLFYGQGVQRWEYNASQERYGFRRNIYTDDNVYWLMIDSDQQGKRASTLDGSLRETAPILPEGYRVRVHEESEDRILILTDTGLSSGYEWYWVEFRGNARNFPQVISDVLPEPVDVRMRFFGLNDARHTFSIQWNQQVVGEIEMVGAQVHTREFRIDEQPQEGQNLLGCFHSGNGAIRLDWYQMEYSRRFVAQRGELFFDSSVNNGIAEFGLEGFADAAPRIFRVSGDLTEVKNFVYDATAGTAVFQDLSGNERGRYIALSPERLKRPAGLVLDDLGGLLDPDQGAEYVIITHADFSAAAERLAAWRASDDRFGTPPRTMVVDVADIYDDFSGGILDPSAIRNFIKYAFDQWDLAPIFVTFMGDGTYDYKDNSGNGAGNWIPPFQDGDSTYDEWFVRVSGQDVRPDLAIGRLPIQSLQEATGLVDKIIAYDREPEVGPWQSRILLVADDLVNPSKPTELEDYFLLDADTLAAHGMPEDLDITKLYLAQFSLEGRTKPRGREEFIRRFNEGALILTYVGHANRDVLAHEQMFVLSRDGDRLDNGRRLPFFYTAASQVGVFDDPVRQSMPEVLLNRADGGVIGMIAATRVGYQTTNMILADSFHEQMYRSKRKNVPLGLALMEAKQFVNSFLQNTFSRRRNTQRYSLFGDSIQRLARPLYTVVWEVPDTLRALEEVQIQGWILDQDGQPAPGFSGQARVQVFDSAVPSALEGIPYTQQGVPLFRGLSPVEGGGFEVVFRVPKDITYKAVEGRVSAFIEGVGNQTAFGSVDGLVLAGTADAVPLDEEGPQISLGFVGRTRFKSGDSVPPDAVFQIEIRDSNGINITGEIGHEIELRVDEAVFRVTEFFTNKEGGYQTGTLEFPLPALEPGEHVVRLKAWDSFNNSSRLEAVININAAANSLLADMLFHPNPLQDQGHFTYTLRQQATSVSIQVFSLTGRLVDELVGNSQEGYNQVAWIPPAGLANGTYLYRIGVQGLEGSTAERNAAIQLVR
jgi:hypothetical protein